MKHFLNTTLKAGILAGLMLATGAPAIAQQNVDKPKRQSAEGRAEGRAEAKMQRANMTVAERVEMRLKQMDKQLDLTDAQVAQLRPILTEDIAKIQQAREAMKAARQADKSQDNAAAKAARADMKAQLQTTKDRISAILTPEQREKAAAKMKKVREHMRENFKARQAPKIENKTTK